MNNWMEVLQTIINDYYEELDKPEEERDDNYIDFMEDWVFKNIEDAVMKGYKDIWVFLKD